MRVYLPATFRILAEAAVASPPTVLADRGFAVTPGLREWYASGDTEELEYVAMSLAAGESIALLAADPSSARRRVVVVAEIADSLVTPNSVTDRATRGQVRLSAGVPLSTVDAIHVDASEAAEAVGAAAADLNDEQAAEEAADHELLWYATQELAQLLTTEPG